MGAAIESLAGCSKTDQGIQGEQTEKSGSELRTVQKSSLHSN